MKIPKPRRLPSGTWFIQLRLEGKSVSVTAKTAIDCRKQAELIKARHNAGLRPTEGRTDKTFRQAIDDYIRDKDAVLSPATIRGYRMIQKHRFPAVMDKRLDKIRTWQREINAESKKYCGKTVVNAWGLVTAVLNYNKIPVPDDLTLPQVIENESPWLRPTQIFAFVDAVHGTNIEIPALLALHSLRCSEIYAVNEKRSIDLAAGMIYVHGAVVSDEHDKRVYKETNKNSKSRREISIMIPELKDALTACGDKPFVTISPSGFYHAVNRICRHNGLPEVGVHGLRHSFASLAHYLHITELDCMRMGGWSDYRTMHKIYTHLDEDMAREQESIMAAFYQQRQNANEMLTDSDPSLEPQGPKGSK